MSGITTIQQLLHFVNNIFFPNNVEQVLHFIFEPFERNAVRPAFSWIRRSKFTYVKLMKGTVSGNERFHVPHQWIIVVFKAPGRHLVGGRLSSLQLENNVEKSINDAGELANITYLVSIQDHASSRYLVLDHTPAIAVFYLASRLTYGMLASTLY